MRRKTSRRPCSNYVKSAVEFAGVGPTPAFSWLAACHDCLDDGRRQECWFDIEIFAPLATNDYATYLEYAEDVNLKVLEIIGEAGTGLALRTQTLRVEDRDSRSSSQK